MRKLFLLFFVMLAVTIAAHAQNRTITGVVTGEGETEPLIGVTITVKGSPAATATDVNGKFSIKVTNLQNVTLGAKFIGFQYQELTLKPGETVANFKLAKSSTDLAEVAVVATGYGNTLKSKLLGSVSEIKGSEIEDVPVANMGTALVNRIAGVNVSVAGGSGRPGATSTLTLQGAYNLSAGSFGLTTDPLYVIDGLIAQKSDFDNLDASLVESISFLKDAQAAIYGAAADKGVVLITTKKGKPGKAQITYSGYFGTTDAAFKPKLLTGYQLAKTINDGLELSNSALNTRFSQADLDFVASNPYPSWYDQLWHSSTAMRHTVNVSGGSERVTFFGGASYYKENSNFGYTNIQKYNIRSGMTAKITDDVTAFISLNTSYNTDYRNTAKSENSDQENTTFGAIIQAAPWVPLTINGLPNYWNGPSSTGGAWNPLAYFNSGSYATSNSQVINLNASLDIHPHLIKGLSVKVQFGKNNYLQNGKQYYPSYTLYQFNATGQNGALYSTTPNSTPTKTITNSNQISVSTGSTNEYEVIGSVDYGRTIKNHTFDLLFVATQNESTIANYNTLRTTQQIPGVDQLFAFDPNTSQFQGITTTESGNLGYVFRANYDYSGKYLVQFIDRIDGSAQFAEGHRFGSSPAVAVGWRASEEPFFKKYAPKFFSTLKFRYSVGVTGDDRVQGFLYKSRFTVSSATALFGSTVYNGLDASLVPSPDITWEHNRASTFGIDATFFNDKLSVTAEFWNKHYYDGIAALDNVLPWTFGQGTGAANYAEANTWGSSFTIGYVTQISKDWGFNANVNFGWGDSQATKQLYSLGALGTVTEYQNINIGELASKYSSNNYGLIAKGIIRSQAQLDAILAKNPNYTIEGKTPQVGWMDFVDRNNDGKITKDADTGLMYDSTSPALSMGMTYGVSYRSFRFNVNGFLQLGGKIMVTDRNPPTSFTSNSSGALNQAAFWADHWTPTNPDAVYPRTDSPDLSESSTFWVRSGTRLYINNATLSYALPKAWGDRLKIPNLRLLLSATNLWAIINPFDYKDVRSAGITTYPTLRTVSLGVNLTL